MKVYALRPENRFRLNPAFVADYVGKQPNWGFGLLSYVTFKRTYARRVEKEQLVNEAIMYLGFNEATAKTIAEKSTQTTEEYWQTCVRVVEGVSSVLKQHVRDTGQPWSDDEEQHHAEEMFRRLWAFQFTPPGRGFWGMGTEALEVKGSGILNNCGFVSTERLADNFSEPFCTLMDYSMLGVGMGFDVLGAGKVVLSEPTKTQSTWVVEDTREGWIAALRVVLDAYVGKGALPNEFNFDEIRKEGLPLKTFGGTSSGPAPLMRLLGSVNELCEQNVGKFVSTTFIVDVMNLIGVCVVAGNVRRSSEIALGSPTDAEFLGLKNNEDLNALFGKQQEICAAIPGWQDLQAQITSLYVERSTAGWSVLDAEYAEIQTKIDDLTKQQSALSMQEPGWFEVQKQINAHPLMSHRWASNNTVMCEVGKTDYAAIMEHTIRNGEPGLAWPEIFRGYGRLADSKNDKDRNAKGFNPCVPAGTVILTRSGYLPIETLVGQSVEIWNGEAWAPVTPKVTGHDQALVRVDLSDGTSLTCTEYHKWHLAPKRRGDDDLVVPATALMPGDALAKYDMPIVESGNDWSSAYTHGFFCGDGQVSTSGTPGVLLYGVKKDLTPFLEDARVGALDEYGRLYVGLSRDLPAKFTLRHDLSVASRLAWLAGLLDADGCVMQNPNSVGLMLESVNKAFLLDIRLMLTTLGVQAKVIQGRDALARALPDGAGGLKSYQCQATWRIAINATDTYALVRMGLKTHRLALPLLKPQRDARRFVTVESVTPVGIAPTVYCFEEPITHRGTFEGIVTGQCGEQTLHDNELCCLVETYPTKHESLDDFLMTLKYAYRYAKAVTLIPTHNKKTNAVMVRNRRIGTSMAGIAEMYSTLGLTECVRWWKAGYDAICYWDGEYSGWLGVNESIKKTSIKPGGTTPLLVGVEGGLKLPTSQYYMRTIRIDHISPLIPALESAGYRVETDRTTPRTKVVYFPCKAPDGVRLATETTVWEQAVIFTALQKYWSDNMVSATLTFQPNEAKDLARLVQAYEGQWKCVSFLPLSTHGFLQAPYTPCTKEQYEEMVAKLSPVEFDGVTVQHDSEDKFCSGGLCEVKR